MHKSLHGNLQVAIDQQLRELGYEICGDDDTTGWSWRLGSFDSSRSMLAFDTIEDATAAAMCDLAQRTGELIRAGRAVVGVWERGDLAKAVRELATCINAFEPDAAAHATNTSKARHVTRETHETQTARTRR
jgi:hypothetical protein